MDPFITSLQSWQFFFTTVATVSATLTGLLFVSLSLNRARLTDKRSHLILASARLTFSDFLYVLMIALVFLIPHLVPLSLTVALLTLGLSRGIGILRDYQRHWKKKGIRMNGAALLRELGLPAVASVGLIAVAIAIIFGRYASIYWLVGVIAALLLTACWRAWILLVEE